MTMTTKQTNRPSHRVYAVTRNGERSNWREIGAAWAHKDGEGFSLKLDFLPLNGAELGGLAPVSSILSRIRRYRTILNKSAGDPYPRTRLSSVGDVAK
jgi:hypothetical protein